MKNIESIDKMEKGKNTFEMGLNMKIMTQKELIESWKQIEWYYPSIEILSYFHKIDKPK